MPRSPESNPMSEAERHEWSLEHVDGYRSLIDRGLTADEADLFIALAIVENHAPFNLSQEEETTLKKLRKKMGIEEL